MVEARPTSDRRAQGILRPQEHLFYDSLVCKGWKRGLSGSHRFLHGRMVCMVFYLRLGNRNTKS